MYVELSKDKHITLSTINGSPKLNIIKIPV